MRNTTMEAFLGQIQPLALILPLAAGHCAGQLLAISQNTALFSLLGTNYGGTAVPYGFARFT